MKHFSLFDGSHTEREHRLMFHQFIDSLNKSLTGNIAEYNDLTKQNPDIKALFSYASFEPEVTIETLEKYMNAKKNDALTPFEEDLAERLSIRKDPDNADRRKTIASLENLVSYIVKHNDIVRKTSEQVHSFRDSISARGPASDQVSNPLTTTTFIEKPVDGALSEVKSFLGNARTAFDKTESLPDKAVIVGGAFFAVLGAYAIAKKALGLKGFFGTLKNVALLGLGTYLTVKAVKTMNRSSQLINGKPLFGGDEGGNIASNVPEWNEKLYEAQLKKICNELRSTQIPPAFIAEMLGGDEGKQDIRFVKGIMNLSVLPVSEFVKKYQAAKKNSGLISDADWPQYPCPDSEEFKHLNLKEDERFTFMKKIGQSAGLIDAEGNVTMPADPNVASKDVLYLLLDTHQTNFGPEKDIAAGLHDRIVTIHATVDTLLPVLQKRMKTVQGRAKNNTAEQEDFSQAYKDKTAVGELREELKKMEEEFRTQYGKKGMTALQEMINALDRIEEKINVIQQRATDADREWQKRMNDAANNDTVA